MTLKEKLLEIPINTTIYIVGAGKRWNISVKNPDKDFKNTFRDILEREVLNARYIDYLRGDKIINEMRIEV